LFFSSRRRHTRFSRDWSSDVCSSDLPSANAAGAEFAGVTVSTEGAVNVSYADGSVEAIGSVAVAGFIAPTGLKRVGSSNWESTRSEERRVGKERRAMW